MHRPLCEAAGSEKVNFLMQQFVTITVAQKQRVTDVIKTDAVSKAAD